MSILSSYPSFHFITIVLPFLHIVDNGCLWVVKGSHHSEVKRRFIRNEAGTGTTFLPPGSTPEEYDIKDAVPVEMKVREP